MKANKQKGKTLKANFVKTDIKLRSEEVQELMGEIPPIIQIVSIIVILTIVVVLFLVCYVVKCPEKIQDGQIIYSSKSILENNLQGNI
jgi:hypothetical protein